jgi:acetyl/propionyl-CoA carboxylase alpha subunit
MPGKVVAVIAANGQQVKKGEPLVIMEAMKMEHTIAAPSDGLVEEVLYQVGDQVGGRGAAAGLQGRSVIGAWWARGAQQTQK